ncbi:MAG: aminotransferase class I/II-fold pyridoxal phosphate-dependent enzyme [Bacillota bacterium]|nr:aminotransferase class I/II-fold pyridoxal phosphate-dependent enzyme [Bacillota bacterium]
MDLKEKLAQYSKLDIYPMHMPGHKRNQFLMSMADPYSMDITEITGFDDLHHAHGILSETMERAAKLFGCEKSHLLVNGSTSGILAAITAAVKKGDTVLVARNCHKSVYHAMELYHLNPIYLMPEMEESFGICGSINPREVAVALDAHRDIAAVILTSPTYEGVVSDIAAIVDLAHEHGVPLIVDEAHGAHLPFDDGFPLSAVACGADLVVQSLHKTLPSLTQTAVLHHCGSLVSGEKLHHQLEVFQTSSPSYILMASIGACITLLERERDALFTAYRGRLSSFYKNISCLKHLRVFDKGDKDSVFAHDQGKIVISCRGASFNGTPFFGSDLARILREQHRIEVEMAASDYVIAMTSIADTDEGFVRLVEALKIIDRSLESDDTSFHVPSLILPAAAVTLDRALRGASVFCPFDNALGKVSAEYIYAYPPGIPFVTPGERISAAVVRSMKGLLKSHVELHSTSRRMPKEIRIIVDFNG